MAPTSIEAMTIELACTANYRPRPNVAAFSHVSGHDTVCSSVQASSDGTRAHRPAPADQIHFRGKSVRRPTWPTSASDRAYWFPRRIEPDYISSWARFDTDTLNHSTISPRLNGYPKLRQSKRN